MAGALYLPSNPSFSRSAWRSPALNPSLLACNQVVRQIMVLVRQSMRTCALAQYTDGLFLLDSGRWPMVVHPTQVVRTTHSRKPSMLLAAAFSNLRCVIFTRLPSTACYSRFAFSDRIYLTAKPFELHFWHEHWVGENGSRRSRYLNCSRCQTFAYVSFCFSFSLEAPRKRSIGRVAKHNAAYDTSRLLHVNKRPHTRKACMAGRRIP